MPNLVDIVEVAEALESKAVYLASDRCVVVRNRHASCAKCADACPTGSVFAANNVLELDGEGCVACGACTTVCPVEALIPLRPLDEDLASSVASAVAATGGKAVFACARIASKRLADPAKYAEVPCLARMEESVLLGLAARGVEDIVLVDGTCATCKFRSNVPGIDATVASANELMAAQGSDVRVRRASAFPDEVLLEDKRTLLGESRRGFFTSARTRAKDAAGKTAEVMVFKNDNAAPSLRERLRMSDAGTLPQFNPQRRMLVLDAMDRLGAPTVPEIDTRLFGSVSIDTQACSSCNMCTVFCPTGALRERDDTETVFDALADPDKIVLVQIAPAVRSAWGEELGIPREEATVERLACALRRLGFEYVFDTDFSADLTIMEEGSELLERLGKAAKGEGDSRGWPMFTSCCPGWVRFVKARYPEFVDSLSTSKSPQQMFGAIAKTYYAKVLGVEPERLFVVSVMPCTAKKAECALPSMVGEGGVPDVDVALTVREMVRMIRASHVSVDTLTEEPLDTPLGFGTGAGVIFGATGGVMEAAVRSAYYLVTGKNPDADFFTDVRGLNGWKEAVADIDGTKVRVAVAHGLGNAARLLDAIRDGRASYDFVEVMACPGGCVGGGGQPIHDGCELAAERGQVLWDLDAAADIRFSHENPDVQACYREFLGAPLSPLAEELLHTDHHAWTMPNEGMC